MAFLLARDLRVAGRLFVKQPAFTVIVVLTLGLAIGLNTTVYSALEATLLRPPPGIGDANDLVRIYRSAPGQDWGSNSVRHYLAVRERTGDVFVDVAATAWRTMSITTRDAPRTVLGQVVSANYFSLLGVPPAQGRYFLPDEDEGWRAHPVIVLSDGFWREAFGADPSVIGRAVPVNGQRVTIVGIAPPGFRGLLPILEPAFWIPLTQLPYVWPTLAGSPTEWEVNFLDVVARRRPGASLAQAVARLDALAAEQLAERPDEYRDRGIQAIAAEAAGITPGIRTAQIGIFGVIAVVVGLLLLLACSNVASLFLARANDRACEMATRLALGAGRGALVRQLLVESLVYAAAAAGAGLFLASMAIGLVNRISLPISVAVRPDLRLSAPVLAITALITVVTALIFGLWPALQSTRPSVVSALKGEAAAGGVRSRARRALVVLQAALSMILLTGAGLFLANLERATAVEKGFVSDGLLLAGVDPSLQGYSRAATEQFQGALLGRLQASPMVVSAAFVADPPLGIGSSEDDVEIPGRARRPEESMSIFFSGTTPGYFETMGTPVRGRDFGARDDSSAAAVIIVNQRFVDRFWPGEDGLGKVVRFDDRERTIIGIVPTGKYRSLGEDPTAYLWLPQAQQWRAAMNLVVRTRGLPDEVRGLIRREVAALDPNLPLAGPHSMDEHLGYVLLPARMSAMAFGAFGGIGLLLAAIGLYGVMAHAVSQRTREIGIRMAIGASPRQVVGSLVREGVTLVAIGTIAGILAATVGASLLRHLLLGAGGNLAMTCASVAVLLLTVALVATVLPARRASAIDPAIALRRE
ncbi:MAG: ABC transporter permease [Gemmatimonadetes bacterium]|nr:ABC transporter permease [Gemmatimonadota bacterium]